MSQLADRFTEWGREPPADLFGDPMWRLPAFRISLFLAGVVRGARPASAGVRRGDVKRLLRTGAPRRSIDQLERCVPSIKEDISEGYSKFSGKERARFYEMALCSAREAREWY